MRKARKKINKGFEVNNESTQFEVMGLSNIYAFGVDTAGDRPGSVMLMAKALSKYLLALQSTPELVVCGPQVECVSHGRAVSYWLGVPLAVAYGLSDGQKEIDKQSLVDESSNDEKYDIWENTDNDTSEDETSWVQVRSRLTRFKQQLKEKIEIDYSEVQNVLLMVSVPVQLALHDVIIPGGDDKDTDVAIYPYSLSKFQFYHTDEVWQRTMFNNVNYMKTVPHIQRWRVSDTAVVQIKDEDKASQMEKVSEEQDKVSGGSHKTDEDEMETVYVSIDLPYYSYKRNNQIDREHTMQISGLNENAPLVRIGDIIYEGTWSKLVGTELVFPEESSLDPNKRNLDQPMNGTDKSNEEDGEVDGETRGDYQDNAAEESKLSDTNLDPDTVVEEGQLIYHLKYHLGLNPLRTS